MKVQYVRFGGAQCLEYELQDWKPFLKIVFPGQKSWLFGSLGKHGASPRAEGGPMAMFISRSYFQMAKNMLDA